MPTCTPECKRSGSRLTAPSVPCRCASRIVYCRSHRSPTHRRGPYITSSARELAADTQRQEETGRLVHQLESELVAVGVSDVMASTCLAHNGRTTALDTTIQLRPLHCVPTHFNKRRH